MIHRSVRQFQIVTCLLWLILYEIQNGGDCHQFQYFPVSFHWKIRCWDEKSVWYEQFKFADTFGFLNAFWRNSSKKSHDCSLHFGRYCPHDLPPGMSHGHFWKVDEWNFYVWKHRRSCHSKVHRCVGLAEIQFLSNFGSEQSKLMENNWNRWFITALGFFFFNLNIPIQKRWTVPFSTDNYRRIVQSSANRQIYSALMS